MKTKLDLPDPSLPPARRIEAKLDAVLAEMGSVRKELARLTRTMQARRRQHRIEVVQVTESWEPRHDYLADWNQVADERGFRRVLELSPRRRAWLREREGERTWDWPALVAAARVVEREWTDGFRGWGFDWISCSQENYLRVLEGRYQAKKGGRNTWIDD